MALLDDTGPAPERIVCPLPTKKLVDMIMMFVVLYNEPAGIHVYAYQRVFMRRIIESVLDREGSVITGLWSRQSGKSEALSSLASALCIIIPTLFALEVTNSRSTLKGRPSTLSSSMSASS
jgi:hypothetical protein